MTNYSQQRGIALLTAILVLALAVIAATSISANHQLSIRRAENVVFGSQVWSYLHGGETWAKVILARDLDDKNSYDHESEAWATELPALPLPGGYISGKIQDEQGKININNLLAGADPDPLTRIRLESLFSLLELDPTLIQAVIDWIDPDVNAIPPNGAEDDYYTGLESPYLTANRPMQHISEIRLVKGFDQEIYDKVKPFLTALPSNTAVNVNTAKAEVIASAIPNIGIALANNLIEERDEEAFKSVQEFVSNPLLQGTSVNLQALSVGSSYFSLNSQVKVGNSFINNTSILNRINNSNITVVTRVPGY
ncbi:MAG: type II secretion system minor pseudopilin GspK [Gammaproteobacteria bacterium]|nr:type II secretion system minor pseudopilin GspK [Gammaproteobacteria bacterium]